MQIIKKNPASSEYSTGRIVSKTSYQQNDSVLQGFNLRKKPSISKG